MKKTIAIDFDGVLHDYSKGWLGPDRFNKPLDGAAEFTHNLHEIGWRIVLNTTREDTLALRKFLADNNIEVDAISNGKPMASIYLDDRGLKFNGNFAETLEAIEQFKVWYK